MKLEKYFKNIFFIFKFLNFVIKILFIKIFCFNMDYVGMIIQN